MAILYKYVKLPRMAMKKRCNHIFKLIIIISILCTASFFIIYDFNFLKETRAEEIQWFVFLATALLAGIAYYEFSKANKLSNNEFLLYISNRWGSIEVINARQIIHEFFVNHYGTKDSPVFSDYPGSLHHTGKDILELSRKSGDDGKSFVYLLNLIDFLETISFFYSRGDLDLDDIQNTCGHNFIFLYKVFELYKQQRQRHDKTYFYNIDLLFEDLNKRSSN